MELSNQKMELFFHFQASNQKTSFRICFTFFARSLELIFKTGNRTIKIGNGIISLTSWPLIKKLLPKDFFHFTKEIKIDIQQEIELFLRELFFQIPGL